MKKLYVLILTLLIVCLIGCTKEPIQIEVDQAEKEINNIIEEEIEGLPEDFPVYSDAIFDRKYDYGSYIRYVYKTNASIEDLYFFYLDELQDSSVVVRSLYEPDIEWAEITILKDGFTEIRDDTLDVIITIATYPDYGMEIHKDIFRGSKWST